MGETAPEYIHIVIDYGRDSFVQQLFEMVEISFYQLESRTCEKFSL